MARNPNGRINLKGLKNTAYLCKVMLSVITGNVCGYFNVAMESTLHFYFSAFSVLNYNTTMCRNNCIHCKQMCDMSENSASSLFKP